MKKKTKYPLILSIVLGSVMSIYFNARRNVSTGQRNTINQNNSSGNQSKKSTLSDTKVQLSYDADMRLVLRNNLRTFTQNILHAYLPEKLNGQKEIL